MSRAMKKTLLSIAITSALLFVFLGLWIYSLNRELNDRLSKEWFSPPVEFYYSALPLHTHQRPSLEIVLKRLSGFGYRERHPNDPLQKKDFYQIPITQCEDELEAFSPVGIESCLRLRAETDDLYSLVWSEDQLQFFKGESLSPIPSIFLEPQLIGEFQGGQPLKSRKVKLSEVPLMCLQAVTAIEDNDFLKHSGVSPSGIVRAMVRNLAAGRFAQGGSTITQQLVKNYFLTHEKTLKRKITEQIIAVLLETKLNKDQILEKYLNVIYMGQEGPYQIIGLGSGARHYFSKQVSDLELSECALLAALINNPGRYNPFKHPEESLKRKNLVLEKMRELEWISENERQAATSAKLPVIENLEIEPSAPYFLEVAYQELVKLELSEERGFKVLTSLSPADQIAMENGIKEQLLNVQKRSSSDIPIEVAAVRIDLPSFQITSLVGGSNFRTSPFNRALRAERQIGSIIKPFIYLLAFENYKPWDKVSNQAFTWKYDGKDWSPRNYDRTYSDELFIFEALAKSLNTPAARLAKEVGIDEMRSTLIAAGLERKIPKLPSVALGALELTPIEVAQIYATLGNFGLHKNLSSIVHVEDFDGKTLYVPPIEKGEQTLPQGPTATLISTLKLSSEIGTAQGLKSFVPTNFLASKTGTTNDLKDAWFVGFDPTSLMVVWVGRDDNTATKLTGSSGALPIWGAIERKVLEKKTSAVPGSDFKWPKGTFEKSSEGHQFIISE